MLLKTHVATALLLTYIFDCYISQKYPFYASNLIARPIIYATSAILQYLLDQIGHSGMRYKDHVYPARNLYHSLPAVVLIGLATGTSFYLLLGIKDLLWLFVSVMLLHWLEDLVTEGGVYVGKKRIRLPRGMRIKYNSVGANRVAILVFLVLALTYANPLASATTFALFLLVATIATFAYITV